MYQYQFNIALNGRHLFRTDWYDFDAGVDIQRELLARFPAADGFKITRSKRDTSMTSTELAN
jgi:hypothetical protein